MIGSGRRVPGFAWRTAVALGILVLASEIPAVGRPRVDARACRSAIGPRGRAYAEWTTSMTDRLTRSTTTRRT